MFNELEIVWYDGKDGCAAAVNYPNPDGLIAFPYLRYWHGYQIFTKPLLRSRLILGQIRLVFGLAAILACIGFFNFAAGKSPDTRAPAVFQFVFAATDLGKLEWALLA